MASDEGQNGSFNFRFPCHICNRQFASEALERHLKICEKTSQKKRKAFDSAKQRIQGTDIPTVSSTAAHVATPPPRKNKSPKKSTLKQRQNAFPDGRSSAKGPTVAPLTLRSRLNSDLVQCPTCERNFSEKAAERHISWCREQNARIPRSPPCTDAKVRLTTRIQYKAPMPGKRRNSPPRTFPMSKSWHQLSQTSVNSVTSSPTSPNSQQGVKVTGTAITAHLRNGDSKKSPPLPSPDYISDVNNGLGGSTGMIHSTSWEWVTPNTTLDQPPKTNINSKLLPKRSVNLATIRKPCKPFKSPEIKDDYDPYLRAQRQMEELILETSVGPTNPITPKPALQNNRVSTNQVRENKLRSNPSTLSLNSDHDIAEIEEMIEDLAFEDDPKFEDILIPMNRKNRLPRRAVSREEALFGTKNSSGSQDSDYGSLLMQRSPSSPARLSPAQRKHGRTCDIMEHNLLTSTSSSETSLPPLGLIADVITKLPRFCHECGTKYPIANAKFCCECGIKRLLATA